MESIDELHIIMAYFNFLFVIVTSKRQKEILRQNSNLETATQRTVKDEETEAEDDESDNSGNILESPRKRYCKFNC